MLSKKNQNEELQEVQEINEEELLDNELFQRIKEIKARQDAEKQRIHDQEDQEILNVFRNRALRMQNCVNMDDPEIFVQIAGRQNRKVRVEVKPVPQVVAKTQGLVMDYAMGMLTSGLIIMVGLVVTARLIGLI